MGLSLITYKRDANVEKKVNFFADYFNHLNKNLGQYSYLDFETPLSLCSKIVFQIENNFEKSSQYLSHHFKHGYFKANDFTNSFKYYKKLRPLIDEYLEEEGKSKRDRWIEDNSYFLRTLKKYIDELDSKQIQVATEILIRLLCCPHELYEHKESIIYLAQVIVSELRFSNKRERDVKGLIRLIMSGDKRTFPLPQKILSRKYETNYNEIATTYLKQRSIETQFRGIINFKENSEDIGYNLIRVYKLQIPVNETIKYGNVEFFNPQNSKFDEIKRQKEECFGLSWSKFIEPPNISIAIVKGIWNDEKVLKRCISDTERGIDYINNKLERNAYLDPYKIRWTRSFKRSGYIDKPDKNLRELSEDELRILKGDNLFELLNGNPSKAAKTFLLAEKFYNRALVSGDVSNYWHYIECIIPNENRRKDICASILILNRKSRLHKVIRHDLYWLLEGSLADDKRTKNFFSRPESINIINNNRWDIVYKKSASFEHHPIIKELRKIYKERNLIDNIKNDYKYFYGIFHELYEIRNTYIHGGVTNEYAETKLSLVIPKCVKIIRGEILYEVKRYKRIDMERIIEKITKEAQKYCPYKVNKHGELVHI